MTPLFTLRHSSGERTVPLVGKWRPLRRQNGVVVVFTLIAVVILLITSVALVRSFGTSLTLAGNMAFKRDLVNQSERGVAQAISDIKAFSIAPTGTPLLADNLGKNYSATILPSDSHGIPTILVDDSAWTTKNMTGADIIDNATQIKVRYVVDRQCSDNLPPANTNCMIYTSSSYSPDMSANRNRSNFAGSIPAPIYRVSVRVTGPRNIQTYIQSTFTLQL
jgi:type IV pilus assembly protein PilX